MYLKIINLNFLFHMFNMEKNIDKYNNLYIIEEKQESQIQ